MISKQQCGLFQLGSNRAALNEGREEFRKEDGTGFHKWMTAANLAEVHDHEREAATTCSTIGWCPANLAERVVSSNLEKEQHSKKDVSCTPRG